jgi:polysaccharide biosynthesis transport protein
MSAWSSPAQHEVSQANLRAPSERAQSFLALLHQRWPAALLVFALTFLSAIVLTSMRHKKYDASAQILIQPTDAVQAKISPGAVSTPANAERDINTNAQLITVDPVVSAVRHQLNLNTSLSSLASQISVSGEASSNLVSITARDTNPARAAQLASAFATQYQIYRRQSALAQINRALASAEATPQAKLHGSPVIERIAQLQAAAAAETGGVQIIKPAKVPTSPSSPKLLTSALMGLIGGLALAVMALFGLQAIDRRLLDAPQLESAFGTSVLATLPGGGARGDRARLLSARRQALNDLAARLAFTDAGAKRCVIMISPSNGLQSASAVALGLAEALGVLGRSVVLIEADLAGRQTLRVGESEQSAGLTAVLTGNGSFDSEITDVHFVVGSTGRHELGPWARASYSLLPSGPHMAEPEVLLGQPAMREVLEKARSRADFVFVLSGSLERPSAVLPIASLCDGAIVLVRERAVNGDQARQMVELLHSARLSLLGTVLLTGGLGEGRLVSVAQGFGGLVSRPRRQAELDGQSTSSRPPSAVGKRDR